MTHHARLTVINGSQRGETAPIDVDMFRVGRSSECDLVIKDPTISRIHAAVRQFQGSYYLQDLDSSGGIWLNDTRINAEKLSEGDKIQIGKTLLTFGFSHVELRSEPAATQPYTEPLPERQKVTFKPKVHSIEAEDIEDDPSIKNVIRLTIQTQESYEPRPRPIGYLQSPPYRPPVLASLSNLTPAALLLGAAGVVFVALVLIALL
jgi:pSer/pThr/pTyr-binding forkhead associated (FHA) protein